MLKLLKTPIVLSERDCWAWKSQPTNREWKPGEVSSHKSLDNKHVLWNQAITARSPMKTDQRYKWNMCKKRCASRASIRSAKQVWSLRSQSNLTAFKEKIQAGSDQYAIYRQDCSDEPERFNLSFGLNPPTGGAEVESTPKLGISFFS